MNKSKKKTVKKKPSKRSLVGQVENFGFSLAAIDVMQKLMPKTRSTGKLVRDFAILLHSSESREEFKWASFAKPILREMFQQDVVITRTRSLTFRLPGCVYTPDMNYTLDDGTLVQVEVKGSKFQPGYRDAMTKMRIAATMYYEYKFVLAMPDKTKPSGWLVELIEPDPEYGALLRELFDILKLDQENSNG